MRPEEKAPDSHGHGAIGCAIMTPNCFTAFLPSPSHTPCLAAACDRWDSTYSSAGAWEQGLQLQTASGTVQGHRGLRGAQVSPGGACLAPEPGNDTGEMPFGVNWASWEAGCISLAERCVAPKCQAAVVVLLARLSLAAGELPGVSARQHAADTYPCGQGRLQQPCPCVVKRRNHPGQLHVAGVAQRSQSQDKQSGLTWKLSAGEVNLRVVAHIYKNP